MLRFPAQILPMMEFSSCDDGDVFHWLKLVSMGWSYSNPFSRLHWTEFYVTKLDKGYSIVLSYEWLVHHNPSINWAETKVVFPGTMKAPERPSVPASSKFDIQMVSAKMISHLCRKPGNSIYCLDHHSDVEVNKAFPHSTSLHSKPTSK